jgi:hypothetical protein
MTKREIDALLAAIPGQVAQAHKSTGPHPLMRKAEEPGAPASTNPDGIIDPSNYGFDEFGEAGVREASNRIADKAGKVYNKPGSGTDHSTKGDVGAAKKLTYPETETSGPRSHKAEGGGRTQEEN